MEETISGVEALMKVVEEGADLTNMEVDGPVEGKTRCTLEYKGRVYVAVTEGPKIFEKMKICRLVKVAEQRRIDNGRRNPTQVRPEEFIMLLNDGESYNQKLNIENFMDGKCHHSLKYKNFCFTTRTKTGLCDL